MAGPYRPPTTTRYTIPPAKQQSFSPLDFNQDGKVNFQDIKAIAKNTLDRNDDGELDVKDLHSLADSVLGSRKKECTRCGKKLKKKTKYQTGVCVDCYRNPTDEERCIAKTTSGDRCQRRISDKSQKGYCGIHLRKFEA